MIVELLYMDRLKFVPLLILFVPLNNFAMLIVDVLVLPIVWYIGEDTRC